MLFRSVSQSRYLGHTFSRSYGIGVAQLAGVPQEVIKDARKHLQRLEEEKGDGQQADLLSMAQPSEELTPPYQELLNALGSIDPDQLSPREALDLLYQLKKLM